MCPIGSPMSASTNAGLRTTGAEPPSPPVVVVGARWERIASVRLVPGCITPVVVVCLPELRLSETAGVGHLFISDVSVRSPGRRGLLHFSASDATGVGQVDASVLRLCRTGPTLPAAPPTQLP